MVQFATTTITVNEKYKITIIMGNLTVNIGQGKEEHIIEDYGLSMRSERGDMSA